MNKLSLLIIAGIGLLAITLLISKFDQTDITHQQDASSSEHHTEKANNSSQKMAQNKKREHHEKSQPQNHPQGHSHSHDDSEAGFDFTPYVSKKMADEIRPYTSRSMKGLEAKVDADGNEYVDLKKRWSHVTVSVVDENGKKHTGEWAPK